jgi:RNA polymerase sigma-70 factor, ECF subfamily
MTDPGGSRDSHTMASLTRKTWSPTENPAARVVAIELARIYEEHFRYVWRCLRSLGVYGAQLDDAVQEVFLVVQQKVDQFDGQADLRTWLYAIALRVARRVRRAEAVAARRFLRTDGSSDADEKGTSPHELRADLRCELEQSERLAVAQRALDTLDDPKREVFVLHCIEGMSAPELVQILGIPLNTIYSRIRAARQAFMAATQALEPASASGPVKPDRQRLAPDGTR